METGEIRRRVLRMIADAKGNAIAQREQVSAGEAAGRDVLSRLVTPLTKTVASALIAEGYRCSVSTPIDAVRLSFEPSGYDYIEFAVDTTNDPPALVARTSRQRGNRMFNQEQIIALHPSIGELADEVLLGFLLDELLPFVAR